MNEGDVARFLAGDGFAVVGASRSRAKFGNQVLRCYVRHGRRAHPVHPVAPEIEGLVAVPRLSDLSQPVHGVSIITQPFVTEGVLDQAVRLGVQHVWMQPGAEHDAAMRRARDAGLNVIGHGPCLLVELDSGRYPLPVS